MRALFWSPLGSAIFGRPSPPGTHFGPSQGGPRGGGGVPGGSRGGGRGVPGGRGGGGSRGGSRGGPGGGIQGGVPPLPPPKQGGRGGCPGGSFGGSKTHFLTKLARLTPLKTDFSDKPLEMGGTPPKSGVRNPKFSCFRDDTSIFWGGYPPSGVISTPLWGVSSIPGGPFRWSPPCRTGAWSLCSLLTPVTSGPRNKFKKGWPHS